MPMKTFVLSVACGCCLFGWSRADARDVTFISTSDPHYRHTDHKAGHHNDLNAASIEEMNRITEVEWPAKLGGGPIAKPRGVLCIGDLVDDGDHREGKRNITAEQWGHYATHFGVDGTDALLKYPVFEAWGNHCGPPVGKEKNGFSTQAQLVARNKQRLDKGLISSLHTNGLHHSWDWDDVHFVQLNIYPADQQNPKVKYSAEWHNPQGALTFLKEDLADKVGDSGRPVVLLSHCGFDTDWWIPEDWKAAYEVARDYNVILYLYGHTGTGLRSWAPEGETKKWDCINDGHTDIGFFVIQITDDRIRAGYRCKKNLKFSEERGKPKTHAWDGEWDWKFPFEKKFGVAPKPAAPKREKELVAP